MDPQRLKETYERLENLHERLAYRVRPRSGAMLRLSTEQLEDKLRDLATFTVELSEILREVILSFSTKSAKE